MAIIISHSIKRKEFKKGIIPKKDLQKILDAFQQGIFTNIKGENLPKGTSLIKVYVTTISGARRIVYLVDTLTRDAFFLFYRSKTNKIGKNITIQNPEFRKILHKYLDLLNKDIDINALDIYETNFTKPN